MNKFLGMNAVSDAEESAVEILVRMAHGRVVVEVGHIVETVPTGR